MSRPLLDIRDLRMEGRLPHGGWQAIVDGVCVQVSRGEVVALIGESGAGKSTIALAAMAYARPGCRFVGGEVVFDGESILATSLEHKRALRGSRSAYVPQSAAAAFNAAHTLGAQITEAPLVHRVYSRSQAQAHLVERARRMRLPQPERIGGKYPHQVSGGQLQRLAASMAMSCGPDLLVFDEPTTAIDVTTQVEVLAAFKDALRDAGAAALYVSHDLAVVAQMADRIIVLRHGRIMEQGPVEQIIHEPAHDYTRQLMAAVRPPPKAVNTKAINTEAASTEALSDAALSDADDCYQEAPQPVLCVRGISAGYGPPPGMQVLFDVDLDVPPGQAVGIIGESGCGKSTLARVISGLLPAFAGEVLLDGAALAAEVKNRTKQALQRVQLVLQMPDVAFNPKKKIGHALGRPLEFYMGLGAGERRQRVEELLAMVELPADFADRYPHELSGGQKQRVNLARALAAEPDVILCDEVTSALDTVVGAAIIELLKSLRRQLHTAFVFISHDLSTVASFADRVVVLYAGRVAEQGSTQAVLSPPFHPYTRLLLGSVPQLHTGWLEDYRATAEAQQAMADIVDIGLRGCPFHTRCPQMIEGTCDREAPPVRELDGGHVIACHQTIMQLQ
ncbi:MAG: dipeptide ABC transporter ATP-binding protein [Gammaproteobacteria bacterium]|nr:dipeptide ABC transporter ATP-binding protein [Gammaproteobacteria bacterium]